MEFIKGLSKGVAIGLILGLIFFAGMMTGAFIFSPRCWFCNEKLLTMELRPGDILEVGPNNCAQVIKQR